MCTPNFVNENIFQVILIIIFITIYVVNVYHINLISFL